ASALIQSEIGRLPTVSTGRRTVLGVPRSTEKWYRGSTVTGAPRGTPQGAQRSPATGARNKPPREEIIRRAHPAKLARQNSAATSGNATRTTRSNVESDGPEP